MTEMKARLVDKDGNPLGTAANPLKISGDVGGGVPDGGTTGQVLQKKTDADQDTEWGDVSVATTSWGSITGTLADQTDLNMALGGKVPTTRTVNSKALSSDISLTPADVGAQPADATLTALAGVTTAANKLPYATGEDAFDVCDFTSFGRSLIGTTTASAVRNLIASASSTTATQNIYVDSAATGTGDGSSWTNAFTTIAAARDSLPAVIDHHITIYIRAGTTPHAGIGSLNRIVANGSITIRGEYYWNNAVASAGSSAGKFNLNASDTGISVGDKVLLMKYTGTVGASRPDDAFIDTVASVDGTEITLTTRTTDTFTTSWAYTIVRTEVTLLTISSNNTCVKGLYLKNTTITPITFLRVINPSIHYCICESTTETTVMFRNAQITSNLAINYVGVVCGASVNNAISFSVSFTGFDVLLQNFAVLSGAIISGSGRGHIYGLNSWITLNCVFIKGLAGGTADGIFINGGTIQTMTSSIDGFDASNKLPNGVRAINGGTGINLSVAFGSNITTQKSPANWAATTDGSYVV